MQVDVIYSGPNPLTLLDSDKNDIIYKEEIENELHVLKYEASPLNEGSQLNFTDPSALANLGPIIDKIKDKMLTSEWTAVDIDNILHGNPHAV